MVIKSVLFDLDGTLVDTSSISSLRAQRRWRECVKEFSKTTLYPGIVDLFGYLKPQDIGIGVVTSSVSFYALELMRFHGLTADIIIAWHDTSNHKPFPEPYLKAVEKMGGNPSSIVGVGDLEEDAMSLSRAGVALPIGAGWSSTFQASSMWKQVVSSPMDISKIVS
jgi:beta-phosphoglucomutase-like phosphatase (HAD superfamily)